MEFYDLGKNNLAYKYVIKPGQRAKCSPFSVLVIFLVEMTRRDVLKFQWFTFLPQIHVICEIQNLSIGLFLGFPRVSQQPAKKLYTSGKKWLYVNTRSTTKRL